MRISRFSSIFPSITDKPWSLCQLLPTCQRIIIYNYSPPPQPLLRHATRHAIRHVTRHATGKRNFIILYLIWIRTTQISFLFLFNFDIDNFCVLCQSYISFPFCVGRLLPFSTIHLHTMDEIERKQWFLLQ